MKKRILLSVLALALVLSLNVSALAAAADSVDLSQAKEIALEHAGIDSSEAVFTKAKLDKNVYEIKFYCGKNKYEYEISYESGTVLDYEWDIKSGNQQISQPAASQTVEKEQTEESGRLSAQPGEPVQTPFPAGQLTAGEILDIALAKAGADDFSEVSLENFKLDDGIYKIEFKTKQSRYKYEISASTGELQNQEDKPEQNPAAGSDWISGLQAEEIALEHAGIARTGTKYIHSYYRYYHGAPYAYQVEFGVYSTQYCYVIDLITGEIINSDVYTH